MQENSHAHDGKTVMIDPVGTASNTIKRPSERDLRKARAAREETEKRVSKNRAAAKRAKQARKKNR